MPKCLDDLYTALDNVDTDYKTVLGFGVNNIEYQQSAEHAFIAELYHQFKIIIVNDNSGYYENLSIHFDLEKERFGRRPDLVLHTSPVSRFNQKMYVEVKTNSKRTNFSNDLDKIFLATAPDNGAIQLGFNFGVFIIGKKTFDNSKRIVRNYINNYNYQADARLVRLHLFHFFENEVHRITFNEIINE